MSSTRRILVKMQHVGQDISTCVLHQALARKTSFVSKSERYLCLIIEVNTKSYFKQLVEQNVCVTFGCVFCTDCIILFCIDSGTIRRLLLE